MLTVRKENIGDLARCAGLSPKARAIIEKRLEGGAWTVTLPLRRTNVGRISAYAWFEREIATGRISGVTEDGSHGSAADEDAGEEGDGEGGDDDGKEEEPASEQDETDSLWPAYSGDPDDLPYVAWMKATTTFTTGSVLAAMQWKPKPGFAQATPQDFLAFVSENALEYSAAWWDEVCSGDPNAAMHWRGVSLNFALSSLALPAGDGDGCFRAWARSIRNRFALELVAKEIKPESEAAKELIKNSFGAEWGELIQRAKEQNLLDFAKEHEEDWKRLLE